MIYHYTDSARLPWIIRSGALRPGDNRIGDYPFDFIWATTSSLGDRTATAMLTPAFRESFRGGKVFVVRFALDLKDFFSWSDIRQKHPEWTDKHVEIINKSARLAGADPSLWWCRKEPLELRDVLSIEAKTYANNSWRSVGTHVAEVFQDSQKWFGITLDSKTYYSTRLHGENGRVGYEFGTSM